MNITESLSMRLNLAFGDCKREFGAVVGCLFSRSGHKKGVSKTLLILGLLEC